MNRGMRVHIDKELILETLHLKGLKAEIVNAWSNKLEQVCIEFIGKDKRMPCMESNRDDSMLNCKVEMNINDKRLCKGKIIYE